MDAENDQFVVNLWEVLVMVELQKAKKRQSKSDVAQYLKYSQIFKFNSPTRSFDGSSLAVESDLEKLRFRAVD